MHPRNFAFAVLLGVAACSDRTAPGDETPPADVFRQVSVGDARVCAVVESGAGYCWGRAFGDYERSDSFPTPYGGDQLFRQLSSAHGIFGDYVCGLVAGGATHCQGTLLVGYDGGALISSAPAPLAQDVPLDTIATSSTHFCGLTDSGAAWCWGDFNAGIRGTGQPVTTEWSLEPNLVAGDLTFSSIGAGVSHTCGATAEGAIYCWGTHTRLGAPSATLDSSVVTCGLSTQGGAPCALSPVRAELAAEARALFVGPSASCAVTVDGEVWCWGNLFGFDDSTETPAPQLISFPAEVASIALGTDHACALTTAGEAYCLGWNHRGQLGTGSTGDYQNIPATVAGDLRFTGLSAGGYTTCGITAGGALYCWGSNDFGQLGTGDRQAQPAPVRIRLPMPEV